MTFEIEFEYNEILYKGDVTPNGKDLLVNLTHPTIYETTPTIVFTMHDDESMNYDKTLFDDKDFMPAIANAITNYLHVNQIELR